MQIVRRSEVRLVRFRAEVVVRFARRASAVDRFRFRFRVPSRVPVVRVRVAADRSRSQVRAEDRDANRRRFCRIPIRISSRIKGSIIRSNRIRRNIIAALGAARARFLINNNLKLDLKSVS
jgi:hypothetical protein